MFCLRLSRSSDGVSIEYKRAACRDMHTVDITLRAAGFARTPATLVESVG